jgi:hypothetical protein
MTNRGAKIAAGATVLGQGALGGVALGSNHGLPAASQRVASGAGAAPVVTTASGAVVPATPPALVGNEAGRPSIVTRASGAGVPGTEFDDLGLAPELLTALTASGHA